MIRGRGLKSIMSVSRGVGVNGRRAASLVEEARHLWTRLSAAAGEHRTKSLKVGFCATHPGEGTTSVSTNFALCLGQQGVRVCLVELNLRRPTLAAHFKHPQHAGVTELLGGTMTVDEVLMRLVTPNVDLLVAGAPRKEVFSLLSPESVSQIVRHFDDEFDVVVVDVPPLQESPEAGIILSAVDAAVLVVEANRTRRHDVRRSLSTFAELGVPFAGSVINKMTYDLPVMIDRLL